LNNVKQSKKRLIFGESNRKVQGTHFPKGQEAKNISLKSEETWRLDMEKGGSRENRKNEIS